MPFFSRVFKAKDGHNATAKSKKQAINGGNDAALFPSRRWDDAYARTELDPVEVEELIHVCTQEVKSRGLSLQQLHKPTRTPANTSSQLSTCLSFYYLFGLHPTQALPEPSSAISSELKWKIVRNIAERAFN